MLALLQWRNAQTGEAYPGVETIAEAMSTTPRTVRRLINRALNIGALEAIGPRTGGRKPTTYRMNLPPPPSRPPLSKSAAHPCQKCPPTPVKNVRPPLSKMSAHPCQKCPPNQQENQQENQQQPKGSIGNPCTTPASAVGGVVVVDAFTQLRIEDLRDHPNATPDRMAWIQREAPRARNPAGWARACIVEGWAVPEPTPEQVAEARRARIDAVNRAYRRLSRDQRRALLERAQAEHPRLRERTEGDFELTGAAKRLLAKELGVCPDPKPEQNADYGYPQGRNTPPKAIGSITRRSAGEGVHGDTPRRRTSQKGSNGVIRRSG
jgi:hypothetical protein